MPDEMKGDRSYHEVLRRMGIKNPGELHVQNPVVMTAQVDDLVDVSAPLGNNFYHAYPNIGANVGQRSGFYLASHGCWVDMLLHRFDSQYWTLDGTPPALLNLGQVIPRVLGGEAALPPVQRTLAFVARDVVGNWPIPATWTPQWAGNVLYQWQWHRLYLPPGRVLYSTTAADNQQYAAWISWTEVPPAPPGG